MKKMILYISGYNSTRKEWILEDLTKYFPDEFINYYVLSGDYDTDITTISEIISNAKMPVYIIGHSTGGFWALSMYRMFKDKVIGIHCINPALDIIDAMRKINGTYLSSIDRLYAEYSKNIDIAYKEKIPICIYQSINDEIVDINFNKTYCLLCAGHLFDYTFGHRFDQTIFNELLKKIKEYIL